MLSNGVKIVLEVSEDHVRSEIAMNMLGCYLNIGIDLKSWKVFFKKKPYSVRVLLGPLSISLIHLEKMNDYFDNALKGKDTMDYTEM